MALADPIDFYFDFSSPFGHMAATRIEALAAKFSRTTRWRPILLGAVYKINGVQPTPSVPLKGEYAKRDILRSAGFYRIECKVPSVFPISSVAAARAFYWLDGTDPANAIKLARALFRAYFVDDINISDAEQMIGVCMRHGLNGDAVRAGINDAAVKERLKNEVDQAIARSVFGSPFIVVDGEPFWGMDRLDQVERWLATGGW